MEEPKIYKTRFYNCLLGARLSQAKEKAIQRGHSKPAYWSPIAWVGVLAFLEPKHTEGFAA